MKRWILLVCLMGLLCGCAAVPTFETVDDFYEHLDAEEPASVTYSIPQGEKTQVIRSDSGCIYLCDGYEVAVETLPGGDLKRTMEILTGFGEEALAVMQTGTNQLPRYECAWTSAGEGAQQVGRTVVLDDGNFHYCLTLTALQDEAGALQAVWQEITQSFGLEN